MTRGRLSGVQAIVFDLDDTLYAQVDFKRSGFRAVASWLAGTSGVDEGAMYQALSEQLDRLGPSHPAIVDHALRRVPSPLPPVDEIVEKFRTHRPDIALYPGVRSMLVALRRDYPLGLLSDGLATVQRNKIAALGLATLVDHVLLSDEYGSAKPDPALFERLEQWFGVPGDRMLYVGDNPHKDFIGARMRGWCTVRVASGEHAAAQVPAAQQADFVIAGVGDLPALLATARGVLSQ